MIQIRRWNFAGCSISAFLTGYALRGQVSRTWSEWILGIIMLALLATFIATIRSVVMQLRQELADSPLDPSYNRNRPQPPQSPSA